MYKKFPNIRVEELRLDESDLNTKRMLDLMAVTTSGYTPLYIHVVQRILRDLRVEQQKTGAAFSYTAFKKQLAVEDLTESQLVPLKQRLKTLESFMVEHQAKAFDMSSAMNSGQSDGSAARKGTSWEPRPGHLTIVDLSCPCVPPEMACSLFNVCLSLFLEQNPYGIGRIIALDEAHKYMAKSQECEALTEALLGTIRLQRHLGTRVIIATQEPTISPKLLDLCSVAVVHRFTSPNWLNTLRRHLAGVASSRRLLERARKVAMFDDGDRDKGVDGAGLLTLDSADPVSELFSNIVGLRVGEALVFSPSSIVRVKRKRDTQDDVLRLGRRILKVRIRNRITDDWGKSIMAT